MIPRRTSSPQRGGDVSPRPSSRQHNALPVWVTFVVLLALAFVAEAASPPVTIVDEFTRPRTWDGRIDMPYFDGQNQLRWNDALVSDAGNCIVKRFPEVTMTAARCDRSTVLLSPRVDECRCTGKTTRGVGLADTAVAYLGIDDSSRERWQRIAHLPNGHKVPYLVGANADGLVFDSFEVWSPETGETVHPRITTRHYFDTTSYLPKRNAYLQFYAEVSLFRSKGGLFLQTSDGRRKLLLPVEKSLFGHYRVESISPIPGTSLILLGEIYSKRGPGSARFTLFDLERVKILFQDERSKGHYIGKVQVIAGPDGHIAFSYLDESEAKYHVVHYRLQRWP